MVLFPQLHRLQIGIALLIQYIAPAPALAGLALVVEIWSGLSLDAAGVAATLGAAGSYAPYILMAEHRIHERDPISLVCLGFLFASLLWTMLRPWWSFSGVAGALVAWAWLGESLGGVQLVSAAIVLGSIFLAQSARLKPTL